MPESLNKSRRPHRNNQNEDLKIMLIKYVIDIKG